MDWVQSGQIRRVFDIAVVELGDSVIYCGVGISI